MDKNEEVNLTKICIEMPPKVLSSGWGKELLDKNGKYHWLDYSLPRLELQLAMIFGITIVCHFFLKRFGLPAFTSQIIAGLMLSPAILGQKRSDTLFPASSIQVIGSIGTFGYALFLFQFGVKMDLSMVAKANKGAIYVGCISVTAPLISILATSYFFDNVETRVLTFFISPVHAICSFPVITSLLIELKIINSELGRIAQSAAIVGDILSLLLLTTSNVIRITVRYKAQEGVLNFICLLLFMGFIILILRPIMLMMVRNTPEGKPIHQTYVYVIMLLFFFFLCTPRWFDQYMLLAPYILGLAVPPGPPLGSAIVEKFGSMVHNLFLPIFVTTCGLRVENLIVNFGADFTKKNSVIAVSSLVVKFGVCLLPAFYEKMPKKDAVAFALILSCKGIVELAIFSFLNDSRVFDNNTYAFVLYLMFFWRTIVPVLLKWLYDPSRKYASYVKRNILDLDPNSELQIVACIHLPDHVSALINLLDSTCLSKDHPMVVNVLHLVKLRGQATPIFISHPKKRKTLKECSYSENVIASFNKFEGNNWGTVFVNTFTAVSPPNLMHEDICTLALDKLSSIIILPFHRRWYADGSIESEDEATRVLNCKVLERAPCSVGILIDRGNVRRSTLTGPSAESLYNIAVIFLGGSDDREAFSYAKRMSQDTMVNLTVARLLPSVPDHRMQEWDKVLDSVVLRDVKTNGYINYVEKEVADGPETAMIVHSMVNEYDLIIVGRRDNMESPQTSGLKEWSEFPELGILGDLLASIDYSGRCSVLVVQQQQTVK